MNTSQGGVWYFYNPMAVNQGKTAFQRQWGKRENTDDWQRINRTVVNLNPNTTGEEGDTVDSLAVNDSIQPANTDSVATDTAATDPHTREYYMEQIPFTAEQKAASDEIIKDGLFNSGVIFKDKLDNLNLGKKQLVRLTSQYTDFQRMDEAWYHLFLLYSRQGNKIMADSCLAKLQADYPESDWTVLLSDPYFAENAKFGVHIEDSLYAATYDAFKADRYDEVKTNADLSAERFPMGQNRPKFIFINGLGMLNNGDAKGCLAEMKQVVEKYPQSEVAGMAGMIIKGVQEGKPLHGGKFDLGDVWTRRAINIEESDSAGTDTLSKERYTEFIFMLAFRPDSVDNNQLLYEMAKYNFTNFLVRNFDIQTDTDNGISRMMVSGFLSYDEALQYARQLYSDTDMAARLKGCRRIIISDTNLKLLGTRYSYLDYEQFFEKAFAPITVSEEQLLNIPENIEQTEEDDDEDDGKEEENDTQDMFNNNGNVPQQNGGVDFDDDFYQ